MPFSWNQPYPVNHSLAYRWRVAGLFGLFVFLFLYGFKPFGLHHLNDYLWIVTLGFGVICSGVMVFLNIVVYHVFPSFFSESKWTTLREITWSAVNIASIGLGNYLFSISIGFIEFNFTNLLMFEGYTLAIGIFPITISILINQARLSRKFETESAQITSEIPTSSGNANTTPITLTNGNETLTIHADTFVFAKASDNYVEVYTQANGTIKKELIRNTLSNVFAQMQDLPFMLKCHRSYVVNMTFVNHISGNAQGYKLHLTATEERIPVSRKLNQTVKNYFTH